MNVLLPFQLTVAVTIFLLIALLSVALYRHAVKVDGDGFLSGFGCAITGVIGFFYMVGLIHSLVIAL